MVEAVYRYAVAHGETLQYIPCVCGCGARSGTGTTPIATWPNGIWMVPSPLPITGGAETSA